MESKKKKKAKSEKSEPGTIVQIDVDDGATRPLIDRILGNDDLKGQRATWRLEIQL